MMVEVITKNKWHIKYYRLWINNMTVREKDNEVMFGKDIHFVCCVYLFLCTVAFILIYYIQISELTKCSFKYC